MSKRDAWNERYQSRELVWGAEPNCFVAEALGDVAPVGRALDLACGEGRNALWLAALGWRVTAVDYSRVAIDRARELAGERGVEVDWICDDVTTWEPEPGAYALAIVLYLQVPQADFRRALERAARALAPGGRLFMVGHAVRNLSGGVGGPQSADVLWEPDRVAAELAERGLEVESAEHVKRETAEGTAIDVRIRAHRPA